jgi:hypothetical protein
MPFEGEDMMVKLRNECDNGHKWDSIIGAEFLPRHLTKQRECRECGTDRIQVEPYELIDMKEAVAWLTQGFKS